LITAHPLPLQANAVSLASVKLSVDSLTGTLFSENDNPIMGSSEQKFYKDFNQEVPRTISKTD